MTRSALLLLLPIAIFLTNAQATESLSYSAPKDSSISMSKSNLTELGYMHSSLSQGYDFATVGFMHEFDSGFGLGARGLLPLKSQGAQIFLGEAVGRFVLLNEITQIFTEATLAPAFLNDTEGFTNAFMVYGAALGFTRRLTSEFSVGASLGVDYSQAFVNTETGRLASQYGGRYFYSKMSIGGSFYF